MSDSDSDYDDCSSSSDESGGLASFMARQNEKRGKLSAYDGFEENDDGTIVDKMKTILALRESLGIDKDIKFCQEQEKKIAERKMLDKMSPEGKLDILETEGLPGQQH